MDIRCPKCGEPWDMDSLHDEVESRWPAAPWKGENGRVESGAYRPYYDRVRTDFYSRGCEALQGSHNPETMGSRAAVVSSALMDLLGDDVDGLGSELDDADTLGLLDD